MSRSYSKVLYCKITGDSSWAKKKANQMVRRKVKVDLCRIGDVNSIGSGGGYKKAFPQYDIYDGRWFHGQTRPFSRGNRKFPESVGDWDWEAKMTRK